MTLALLYRFIRVYSRTFRLRIENEQEWMAYHARGGTVLLCVWHQQFFAAIRHFRNYQALNPSLMISKSKDGEIIAGIAERSGWKAVRGSSSTAGRQALGVMIDNLKRFRLAAHILDGPRGPSGQVKAGVIQLAHAAEAMIVPIYTAADKAWYFKSWDRFMLPKPFAKVTLRFGEMIDFNTLNRKNDFEAQRLELENTMLPGLII
ncbi:MAG: hypothetical protein CVU53_04030 [Deltaproteobacteria bacterium HGW-Deltaproteobacteria-11]|nr:MAG: hypothetical protein CVU53_04030 [Deltaproteobacteria bacterium HGW-Deltaproteobacteria-11]